MRRAPCEHEVEDQGDAFTNQGMLIIASSYQKPGQELGTHSPSQSLEGASSVDTLNLCF